MPAPGPAAPPLDVDDGVLRVLLVEDDDGDAFLFEELVHDTDLAIDVDRVRTVAAAEEGPAARATCVVLDLGLPDAEGLTALHRLRAAAPGVPTIVLTGLSDTARGLEAVAAGAQDYLVKGRVDGEALARAIRYAVARRRVASIQAQLEAAHVEAQESARLERGLLPRPVVADPRVRVDTGSRPGRARSLLGGDFFDVVEAADGTLHALIGDVCGHDPDAAALGVCLRIAWRTLVLGGRRPDDVLPTLDDVLALERLSEDVFATACMLTVAPDRRRVEVRVAGHPIPILVGAAPRPLATPASRPLLGLGAGPGAWPPAVVELDRPWRVLLFTDGLIEGRVGPGSERLGEERLLELVADHDAAAASGGELIERLIETAVALNGADLPDDVALVLLAVGAGG